MYNLQHYGMKWQPANCTCGRSITRPYPCHAFCGYCRRFMTAPWCHHKQCRCTELYYDGSERRDPHGYPGLCLCGQTQEGLTHRIDCTYDEMYQRRLEVFIALMLVRERQNHVSIASTGFVNGVTSLPSRPLEMVLDAIMRIREEGWRE
jgi:hypothetical protein